MTAALPARQDGFSLVEVLIAMTLAIGLVLAILTTLDKSSSTSLAQQRDTQAASIGEQEIERARSLVKRYGFDSLSLSSTPVTAVSATTNPVDPNAFVAGNNFLVRESWHDTGSTLVANEPLLVAASTLGGADRLAPGPETIVSGTTTATVNRYVTRRVDSSCPNTDCVNDSRRVVVAVRVQANGADLARTTPIWFSTVVNSGVPANEANGSGGLAVGVNLP